MWLEDKQPSTHEAEQQETQGGDSLLVVICESHGVEREGGDIKNTSPEKDRSF